MSKNPIADILLGKYPFPPAIPTEGAVLLAYCYKVDDEVTDDRYEAFRYTDAETFTEAMEDAKQRYSEFLQVTDLHSASITVVLESTDYF